jgi:hypothetical protein
MDQVIDAAMARGLHADAYRSHALVGWVVMQDPPEYLDKVTARLVTETPLPPNFQGSVLCTLFKAQPPMPLRGHQQASACPNSQ